MCPSASTTGWTLLTNLGDATSEGLRLWRGKVAIREGYKGGGTGKERKGEGGRQSGERIKKTNQIEQGEHTFNLASSSVLA